MTTILVPVEAYKLKRGDIVVFPPRVIESRGKHRRKTELEGTGRYEVCSAQLFDGVVKLMMLDRDLKNTQINVHFSTEINTLEWL
jgi:hypothetical protein